MGLPDLHTDRLLLRSFTPDDAERVRELAGDAEVALMTANIPHPYEPGMAEAWIETHEDLVRAGRRHPFAIERPGRGVIGAVGLEVESEHGRAELGYWVGRPYWGRGYATEACSRVLDYGFQVLNLRRVFARHVVENPASGRVLEKLGMTREGVLRQHDLHRGERPVDMLIYGILRDEFNPAARRDGG